MRLRLEFLYKRPILRNLETNKTTGKYVHHINYWFYKGSNWRFVRKEYYKNRSSFAYKYHL